MKYCEKLQKRLEMDRELRFFPYDVEFVPVVIENFPLLMTGLKGFADPDTMKGSISPTVSEMQVSRSVTHCRIDAKQRGLNVNQCKSKITGRNLEYRKLNLSF